MADTIVLVPGVGLGGMEMLIRDGEEIGSIEGDGAHKLTAVHHDADLSHGTRSAFPSLLGERGPRPGAEQAVSKTCPRNE